MSGFKLGQLEPGGKRKEGKGKGNSKPNKGTGEAYPSQPPAYKGKGKPSQLSTREHWCSIGWNKGQRTQACWWNNQQHQKQHQQQQAWYNPSKQQNIAAQALKRYQQHVDNIEEPVAYSSLATDNQPMGSLEHETQASSFEHQTQATTQSASATPTYIIAHLDSLESASSTAETWGILVDTGASTSVAPKSFASDIELSPAPSALQLSTATCKAVETYGLRKVHLQSRGLSLEVTFVIADVVTPLLGLDIMIKNSLSLHVEQDLQHFLVNPAGDRTQLEYLGRHLYLIACPSQHGLSHCFIGSLSQVIGSLPEDRELHEQTLASRSSSSTDLDEDMSKQQVEQESLNFQCQPVLQEASDHNDDLIFDLVSSEEEAADSGRAPSR